MELSRIGERSGKVIPKMQRLGTKKLKIKYYTNKIFKKHCFKS